MKMKNEKKVENNKKELISFLETEWKNNNKNKRKPFPREYQENQALLTKQTMKKKMVFPLMMMVMKMMMKMLPVHSFMMKFFFGCIEYKTNKTKQY